MEWRASPAAVDRSPVLLRNGELPSLAARYARRTVRRTGVVEVVGFAAGGEAGARLLTALAMATSPDTVLRAIRRAVLPYSPSVRVLGLDDFAFRRGQRYGTLLVDLERHCPVDLLADRTAQSVASWLEKHSGVQVISRDRAGAYAEGTRTGAPDAVQVADRFHVLDNLRTALERLLTRHRACLCDIPRAPDPAGAPAVDATAAEQQCDAAMPSSEETATPRARRYARYEQVMTRYRAGMAIKAIARELGMGRRTVRRFVRAPAFPEREPQPRPPSILAPYIPYLRERWDGGCHSGTQLWREIGEQGFTGSADHVREYVARWRDPAEVQARRAARAPPRTRSLSPRRASWLLFRSETDLDTKERHQLEQLRIHCPEAVTAQSLVGTFRRLVREFDQTALGPWLVAAERSGIPELQVFTTGIQRDRAAIDAMLCLPWSNGQLEGQINRLKALKRQMYGRANLDLLRCRVLHTS